MPYNIFHYRLRKFKDNKDYSTKKLALKLNVTDRTVNSWLNGDSQPKATQIGRLAKVLDVTPNEFFYDEKFQDDEWLESLQYMVNQAPDGKRREEAKEMVLKVSKTVMPYITKCKD